MQQFIDGVTLASVLSVGYRNLKKNMAMINDLNVFPVPDGDTGTNMVHTFGGGVGAAAPKESVCEYMKDLAQAVLLSARGNSGVIFSQFISGLSRGFAGKDKISVADLAPAFCCAKEDTYKSVTTPTEGTILTVISEAAEFLCNQENDFEDFKSGTEALLECMKDTLARTPDMLPVLKEAGVVDSGAAGLVCVFEGMYAAMCGVDIEDIEDLDTEARPTLIKTDFGPDSVMEYGYCTEFILQLMNAKTDIESFSTDEFIKPLEEMGDSIVAVSSGGIVKIHIHTFTPEKVLAYARNYGEFVTLKIENMSVQHSETTAAPKKEKVKYAVIPVASGEGIVDYFYSIGAAAVIDGGQTNNPSVDDFLKAFERFDAEHIILLPNNSNIILTANQAAEMYKETDVRVIPTKSIVEGYSALSMMDLWRDTVDGLIEDMSAGLNDVVSAYVTTATRDTVMDGVEISKDSYIGIKNKSILNSCAERFDAVTGLIDKIMEQDEKSVIIVFHGKNVGEDELENLKDYLEDNYPLADLGFIDGKQEIYDYIISME